MPVRLRVFFRLPVLLFDFIGDCCENSHEIATHNRTLLYGFSRGCPMSKGLRCLLKAFSQQIADAFDNLF